MGQSRKLS